MVWKLHKCFWVLWEQFQTARVFRFVGRIFNFCFIYIEMQFVNKKWAEMLATACSPLRAQHRWVNLSAKLLLHWESRDKSDLCCSRHHRTSFRLFFTSGLICQIIEFRNREGEKENLLHHKLNAISPKGKRSRYWTNSMLHLSLKG